MASPVLNDIANPSAAAGGKRRILWADQDMPVLARIRDRFAKDKPLTGLKMAACLHVTAETANLARTLQDGGADLVSAMVFVALNRLNDVHPQVAAWAKKIAPVDRATAFNDVIGSMEE